MNSFIFQLRTTTSGDDDEGEVEEERKGTGEGVDLTSLGDFRERAIREETRDEEVRSWVGECGWVGEVGEPGLVGEGEGGRDEERDILAWLVLSLGVMLVVEAYNRVGRLIVKMEEEGKKERPTIGINYINPCGWRKSYIPAFDPAYVRECDSHVLQVQLIG